MKLFHVTTLKKYKRYKDSGCIKNPVRGFTTLTGAMFWAMKTGRHLICEISGEPAYKLPDHHNDFGDAWWIDADVKQFKCIINAKEEKGYEI